jgi:hypothetical protein
VAGAAAALLERLLKRLRHVGGAALEPADDAPHEPGKLADVSLDRGLLARGGLLDMHGVSVLKVPTSNLLKLNHY